ncbi:MAG: hypothetical protein WAW80_02225 [Candidatus Saccharimonadales bacterium]
MSAEHNNPPRIYRTHEYNARVNDIPKLGRGFLRAIHNRVQNELSAEELHAQRLFEFPDARDDRMYIRTSVTEGSLQDALDAYMESDDDIKLIVNKFADGEHMRLSDVATTIRDNNALRLELGKYLVDKLTHMHYLPSRLSNDQDLKRPNVQGYDEPMTSKEYSALLAMAMLDGTYKDSPGDKIYFDRYKDVKNGQHRYAAQEVLGIGMIAKNRVYK